MCWFPERKVGFHPPLEEASRESITAASLRARREKDRLERAEAGKPERRVKDSDIYPIVIAQNFKDEPNRVSDARERLFQYVRKCGGEAMWNHLFSKWDYLPRLIKRCWDIEKVDEYIEYHEKSTSNLCLSGQHLSLLIWRVVFPAKAPSDYPCVAQAETKNAPNSGRECSSSRRLRTSSASAGAAGRRRPKSS